ncbi:MAG: hypothetical protein QF554_09565 [Dehalococcoidia bacterium]|nr:hypothetical protein [Dehalococcoidia bacterium]
MNQTARDSESGSKYCSQCGSRTSSGDRFCTRCGSGLSFAVSQSDARRLSDLNAERTYLLLELAEVAAGKGQWQSVIQFADKVLAEDPSNAEAANYRDEAVKELGG